MRILVVDDKEENVYYLQALLTGHGHDVVTARHGAEALSLARANAPDLVISDLLMPVMDGYMLLRHWKADPLLEACPFVVYTATYTSERDEELALHLGADAFIIKPCEPEEFLARIGVVQERAREGKPPVARRSDFDDRALFGEYSAVLVRKLEARTRELEESNASLKRDIAERMRIESALREAERAASENAALLRAVLDGIPDTVTHVDLDGALRSRNRAEEPASALRAGEGPGAWLASWPADRREIARAAWQETVTRQQPTSFEMVEGEAPRGERVTWNTLAPVTRDGKVAGVVVVSRDITDRKAAEAQLLVSERMATLGTLAASVAHEINNPLVSVQANLALASQELEAMSRSAPVSQELRDELADAVEGAERVKVIVRDLRLFSRETVERIGPIDVEHVLESTLRMARNELRHKAKVVRSFRPVPPVQANESRLGQVFLNLVMNAAQVLPLGGLHENEIRLAISQDQATNRVVVAISDTGPGISEAVQRQLFRPFVTTKPAGEGTGLGLSICKRIVTDLGGDIDFTSEPGKGSTFFVRLPPAGAPLGPPTSAPARQPHPRRGTILVVDDDEAIGRTLKRVLAKNHDVVVTRSAAEALALIRGGGRFDVILCDLMMPEMSGADFYGALMKLDESQTQRIVFMTGGAFTPAAMAFLASVRTPRLEKPFSPDAVTKVVAARLS